MFFWFVELASGRGRVMTGMMVCAEAFSWVFCVFLKVFCDEGNDRVVRTVGVFCVKDGCIRERRGVERILT